MTKYTVVFVRHGETVANRLRFLCGWYDTHLTDTGIQQAKKAGKLLKQEGYNFDVGFSSVLSRARETLLEILREMQIRNIPIIQSWRLNECHLGGWTGLHEQEFIAKYGKDKLKALYDGAELDVPPIKMNHRFYRIMVKHPLYKNELSEDEVPKHESFSGIMKRSVPFWEEKIVPEIKNGKRVIVASHKLTLKGLVKHLEKLSDDTVAKMDIPHSLPFIYDLDDNMKPLRPPKFITGQNV